MIIRINLLLTNSTKNDTILIDIFFDVFSKERRNMSDVKKILQKMSNQPNGIRFEELKKVLEYFGYTMKKKTGTSHRQFINSNGDVITIKEENPLKAVYVKDVLKRIK